MSRVPTLTGLLFCQSACVRIWRALGAATHENAKRAIKVLPDFIKSTMNLNGMT